MKMFKRVISFVLSAAISLSMLSGLQLTQHSVLATDTPTVDYTPANPNASLKASNLMRFMADNYGEKVITGQTKEVTSWVSDGDGLWKLRNYNGKKMPAIMQFDMDGSAYSYDEVKKWGQGTLYDQQEGVPGIIALCNHWSFYGGYYSDYWYSGNGSWMNESGMTKIRHILEGTATNAEKYEAQSWADNFYNGVHSMAQYLQGLSQAGCLVLWRPFHEGAGDPLPKGTGCTGDYADEDTIQNGTNSGKESGGWFWWSRVGAENFQWMYQYMFEICTEKYDTSNVLWIWNGQRNEFYPGDEYVDIIGDDVYSEKTRDIYYSASDRYNYYHEAHPDKMLALSECGIIPDYDKMFEDGATWSYFATWRQEWYPGRDTSGHTKADTIYEAYNSDRAINLDDLPDFETYNPNAAKVTVTSSNEDWGTVSGGGVFDKGTSVTVTATPANSYCVFEGWKDSSGNIVSTSASYTFTLTAATSLTAVFNDPRVTLTEVYAVVDGRINSSATCISGSTDVKVDNDFLNVKSEGSYAYGLPFTLSNVTSSSEITIKVYAQGQGSPKAVIWNSSKSKVDSASLSESNWSALKTTPTTFTYTGSELSNGTYYAGIFASEYINFYKIVVSVTNNDVSIADSSSNTETTITTTQTVDAIVNSSVNSGAKFFDNTSLSDTRVDKDFINNADDTARTIAVGLPFTVDDVSSTTNYEIKIYAKGQGSACAKVWTSSGTELASSSMSDRNWTALKTDPVIINMTGSQFGSTGTYYAGIKANEYINLYRIVVTKTAVSTDSSSVADSSSADSSSVTDSSSTADSSSTDDSDPDAVTYTIYSASADTTMGNVSTASQTIKEGSKATVTATANSGYEFVNWSENGTQVSTSATYTFTVSSDRTLIATFKKISTGSYSNTLTIDASDIVGKNMGGTKVTCFVPITIPADGKYSVTVETMGSGTGKYIDIYMSSNGSVSGLSGFTSYNGSTPHTVDGVNYYQRYYKSYGSDSSSWTTNSVISSATFKAGTYYLGLTDNYGNASYRNVVVTAQSNVFPTNQNDYTVIYKDQWGNTLNEYTVTDTTGSTIYPTEPGYVKTQGYNLTSWEWVNNDTGNSGTITVSGDEKATESLALEPGTTVFTAKYTVMTEYTMQLTFSSEATLYYPNDENDTVYTYEWTGGNSVGISYFGRIKLVADETKDGKSFSYWTLNGMKYSEEREIYFCIWCEADFVAVYGDSDNVTNKPFSYIDKYVRLLGFNEIDDDSNHRVVFDCAYMLPEGYTYVEAGMIYSYAESNLTDVSFTQDQLDSVANNTSATLGTVNTNSTIAVISLLSPVSDEAHQYTCSITGVRKGKTRAARSYLIYKDSSGNVGIVLSENYTTAVTPTEASESTVIQPEADFTA